ncbi:uncharacterized protein LOC101493917 [Cicer arietinum]|uniref:Uncharacterized protein LOC101493917 n=1 Tax=Cicer arietinum TaxID=3827 RepID=O65752_CICAR|nr:uncharacterized protein LOC101493917 [Cicer arietinum]CAA07227.1 hypothetical protein [Cicer arietinum]
MINPNDPEENSDLVLQNSSSDADIIHPKPKVYSENQSEKGSVRSTHNELQKSKEDGDLKNFVNSPARHDNLSNRSAGDSASRPGSHGVGSADTYRRPLKQSTGSEYSIERSPLHRQAKTPGRDSPSWERKSSYDSSHGTPGRSRLRPANRGMKLLIKVLLFRNLVSGMRVTLHQLMAILTFSTKCGRRNTLPAWKCARYTQWKIIRYPETQLPIDKLRLLLFLGAEMIIGSAFIL